MAINKRMKPIVLSIAALLMLSLSGSFIYANEADAAKSSKPNFLFIIADDMRWDAMSHMQNEQGDAARFPWIKTPNLDQFASESLSFKNAFAATAVCSPSRAEFLTGQYSHQNGVASNRIHFPTDNVTWATALKGVGYTTAYIGKWHMWNQKERPGFDYSASFQGQGRYENWFFLIDGVKTPTKGWVDDVSTDFAIEFMKRDHDKPFAMAVGFKTPHIPFIPPKRAEKRYLGEQVGPVPNFYDEAIFNPKPKKGEKATPRVEQPLWAIDYHQTVSGIDDNIGRLLATLKEQGLDENTVVIFTSDNGYFFGEHGLGDYQGDKRAAYEEAMRIPMLVRYPDKIEAGSVSEELVLNIDLAPTLLDLAGVKIPKEIQGKSWKPLFSKPDAAIRSGVFYEYFYENMFANVPTTLAYRTKTTKFIMYPDHKEWIELYDLTADPYELENLAYEPEHSDLRSQMETAFKKERDLIGYVFPAYADKLWPADYVFVKKKQNYPWLPKNREVPKSEQNKK